MEVAGAIDQALNMCLDERKERLRYMKQRVMQHDADHWARTFMDDLLQNQQVRNRPRDLANAEELITERFDHAGRSALFLDYDGTLRDFEDQPDAASPGVELRALLGRLDAAPVDVYIISGRCGETLAEWMGEYDFTLIAEHGNRFLLPNTSEWQSLNPDNDFSWKENVLEIFSMYEGSTPGSSIEEKQSSVVWHYRLCDPVYGSWKANQLLSDMYSLLGNLPVEIHHGKRIVEASSMHVNKGKAVEYFIGKNSYQTVLCAGDDQTDETMFRLTNENIVSIKVGNGDTHAANKVADINSFHELALKLVTLINKNYKGVRA